MYSFGQNLTPDEVEELRHAELMDALDHMSCDRHGAHCAWRLSALLKVHNRCYGIPGICKYCGPNELNRLEEAWKRPSIEPMVGNTAAPDGFDGLPQVIKDQLKNMNVDPSRVTISNGVIRLKSKD